MCQFTVATEGLEKFKGNIGLIVGVWRNLLLSGATHGWQSLSGVSAIRSAVWPGTV